MHTIILGSQHDYHAKHVLDACIANNLPAVLFDTAEFPLKNAISWDPESNNGVLHIPSADIPFSNVRSVFWSSISRCETAPTLSQPQEDIAQNDAFSMLRTFLMCNNVKWCNSWHDFQFHKVKPRQLALAKNLGATIPKTYLGNDKQSLLDFVSTLENAIYKPVYGGAHCAIVTPELLNSEHLGRVLKMSPVTIQDYIKGTNVRTFVIGEQTFSAEIASESVDFREDIDCELTPIDLPKETAALAIRINKQFGMQWTAIDWRRDSSGHYYFLEANPSPMFIYFERKTGMPITDAIVDMLSV